MKAVEKKSGQSRGAVENGAVKAVDSVAQAVRFEEESPDVAGGDVNEDDLDVRAGNQGVMFVCMTNETVLQNKIWRS